MSSSGILSKCSRKRRRHGGSKCRETCAINEIRKGIDVESVPFSCLVPTSRIFRPKPDCRFRASSCRDTSRIGSFCEWLSLQMGRHFPAVPDRAVSAVRTGERFGPCQCDGYLCRGTSRHGSFCEWLSLLTRMGSKCFRDEFRFKPESIPMVIFSRQVGAPREG